MTKKGQLRLAVYKEEIDARQAEYDATMKRLRAPNVHLHDSFHDARPAVAGSEGPTTDTPQEKALCGSVGYTMSEHELKRGRINCASCLAKHARNETIRQLVNRFESAQTIRDSAECLTVAESTFSNLGIDSTAGETFEAVHNRLVRIAWAEYRATYYVIRVDGQSDVLSSAHNLAHSKAREMRDAGKAVRIEYKVTGDRAICVHGDAGPRPTGFEFAAEYQRSNGHWKRSLDGFRTGSAAATAARLLQAVNHGGDFRSVRVG